jgi:hypothetical protein
VSTTGETLTCRRCGAHAVAEHGENGAIIVQPGWRHVAVLEAGPGTPLPEDGLDAYEVTEGMFLCPAHPRLPSVG